MPPAIDSDLFVGREREMAELTTALEAALGGRGGIAMLAGEPGVGKTRLFEELTEIARNRGALVVLGACYEGGSAPPYWPWTQVIRSLLAEPSDAVLNLLKPRAGVIAELVPEIGNLFPDLEPAPAVDPEQARFRLFDSVTSLLNEIAITQPMVVVLDDLHWADRSTLDLLEFFTREVAKKPMLIVGGYRDMELSRRHPLSNSLATLARISGFQRVLLRGLEGSDTGRLVESIGDIALPPELIEEIHVRTEGNPFFISEVTRDMAKEAAERGRDFDAVKFRIPEGVREAVGVRLNKLSEECNQVLRSVAIIGREFDFALLVALVPEHSDDAMLDLVEEAFISGAVREVPGPGERYEFTHALIQQTLVEELTTGRRVRLHARIVDAIEEHYSESIDEHLAELAHHCAEGETVVGEDKLIRYSLRAGEEALRGYAFEEAIVYFERGLVAHGPEYEDRLRADLLFGIGRAQATMLGEDDLQVAVDALVGAFDIYIELGNSDRGISVAEYPIPSAPNISGVANLTERALALVPEDSHTAGKLLSRHGLWVWIEHGDHEKAASMLMQALGIAQQESDRQLEMWSRANLATVQFWQAKPEESFENAGLAAELAGGIGDLHALAQARQFQSNSLRIRGDLGDADMLLAESLEAAEHLGLKHRVGEAIRARARIAAIQGNWDRARGFMDRGLALDPTDGTLLNIGALVEHHCGNTSAAKSYVERLNNAEPTTWYGDYSSRIVTYFYRRHDRVDFIGIAGPWVLSLQASPVAVYAQQAVDALDAVVRHDHEAAAHHYAAIDSDTWLVGGQEILAEQLMAMLARTAGHLDLVESHFEKALNDGRCSEARPALAWTIIEYAESLIAKGEASDLPRIEELLDEGVTIARELGMKPLIGRFGDLEGRLATRRGKAAYPDGLTAREVEVLQQIAAGRTNQQIADELVIAVNTVTTHVANVLSKTGSANRTEAAAYAAQKGLVEA